MSIDISYGSSLQKRTWAHTIVLATVITLALTGFMLRVHSFLALNEPICAEVLIVEGWMPDYVLDEASAEFTSDDYVHVYVSGLAAGVAAADGTFAAGHLVRQGIDPAHITVATVRTTQWNRTSTMARAVRDSIERTHPAPQGVNVVTLGPHRRQSRLAYRRMLGPNVPVGVITIPKDDYDPLRWWTSQAGIRRTTKDFAGWLRELVFGLRS